MDLSAIIQNLNLTSRGSRSPSPDREVTLQLLPHHTEPPYLQIDTHPEEDILKRNFRDLLVERRLEGNSEALSRLRNRIGTEQATQRTRHPLPENATSEGNQTSAADTSPEREHRERVLHEEGHRQREVLLPRPLTEFSGSVALPPLSPHSHRLASLKHEMISQLRLAGIDSSRAIAMAGLVQGHDLERDFMSLLEFIPNVGSFRCSFADLSKHIRRILEGGSASRMLVEAPEQEHSTPSSASTLIPETSITTTARNVSPRSAIVPSTFDSTIPQYSPSRSHAQVISTSNGQSPPSPISPRQRGTGQSFGTSVIDIGSVSAPPPVPPRPFPRPTSDTTPTWGSPTWDSMYEGTGWVAPSFASPTTQEHSEINSPVSHGYPPLPPFTSSNPVAIHSPPPPPSLSQSMPTTGPEVSTSTVHASQNNNNALPPQINSVTTQSSSSSANAGQVAPLPVTPARGALPPNVKQETSTPVNVVSRLPSASPSTSLFRSGPQMESITIRGNCSIEAHMFTATSPGRITEPPPLRPHQTPHIGDLLFNKFLSSSANWKNAQVWMWTDPEAKGNPGWEDIEEFYGSLVNPITHPRDSTRFLSKAKKDGRPSWLTEATLKTHIEKAAKDGESVVSTN